MVSVPNPLILTDPRIRNPELWMPINNESESGTFLDIFVAIEKDIVIGGKSSKKKFRNFFESSI